MRYLHHTDFWTRRLCPKKRKEFRVRQIHALHGLLALSSYCETTELVHIVTDRSLS